MQSQAYSAADAAIGTEAAAGAALACKHSSDKASMVQSNVMLAGRRLGSRQIGDEGDDRFKTCILRTFPPHEPSPQLIVFAIEQL